MVSSMLVLLFPPYYCDDIQSRLVLCWKWYGIVTWSDLAKSASVLLHKSWRQFNLRTTNGDNCVYPQTGDRIKFRPLKLHYFDRLLQENITGMAVCKNPVMSPQVASPLVSCKTRITVKLPGGAKLRKVKELGKDWVVVNMHKPTVSCIFFRFLWLTS